MSEEVEECKYVCKFLFILWYICVILPERHMDSGAVISILYIYLCFHLSIWDLSISYIDI